MRTTLELDDDLLAAAKVLAKQQGSTLGQVISELARQSLAKNGPLKMRNGVPIFSPVTARVQPDLHLVNQLRDEG